MKYLSLFLSLVFLLSAYEKPPHVGEPQWDFTSPYFLPEDHPAKASLDALFKNGRPTANEKALHDSGFKKVAFNEKTGVWVLKHKDLKGYVIKLYTDDWTGVCDWCMWVKRVKGANVIRDTIERHQFQSDFGVPHKWVYPLPLETYNAQAPQPKDFIMLVEDMDLIDKHYNLVFWKSKLVDETRLNHLWIILTEAGLLDSVYPDNIPFNSKGQIVFIDTEHYHEWPIPYIKIATFLNKKMAGYWHGLINRGGP